MPVERTQTMDLRSHVPPQSRGFRIALISAGLVLGALMAVSQAQVPSAIRPDGTLGTTVTQSGNVYTIMGGTRPGNGPNLFHSFDRFSVGTGDTARFSGPPGIANILSRVTGGQRSEIDGRIQSEIPGANLYVLNPSGIVFGPNATLDVSGSFHVSTADYLRFADGVTFSAHLGQESTLTVAPPAAFGFLGSNPAGIAMQGSSLRVPTGKILSLVGGDVQLTGGTLVAPSGRIQLASVASPGDVMFSPPELAPELQVDSFARLGRLELSQGGLLDVSGNGGGTVLIRSGRLLVDRSQILANTLGDVDGASLGLDLRVAADAVIHDSDLRASPFAAGNGGNIVINVGQLTLADGGRILNSSRGAGRGGTLTVTAADAITITGRNSQDNQSGLFSNAFSLGDAGHVAISALTLSMNDGQIQAGTVEGSRGNAGGLEVRVDTLRMNGGRISANTSGDGNAGNIDMRVGTLTLLGGAQISNSSGVTQFINGVPIFIGGQGQGGTLTVVATESISIAGQDSESFRSGLFSNTNGSGNAGSLFISSPLLSMDGGRILTRTLGDGNAGDIEIKTGRLTLTGGAQIFSGIGDFEAGAVRGTQGPGRGGKVTVSATESIFIAGRDSEGFLSSIASDAQIGRGQGGRLFIATPNLEMRDGFISTGTSNLSTGDAGSIDIQVGRLTLTGGAQIITGTQSSGRGGTLTVAATDMISIAGRDQEGNPSGLFSNTFSLGDAGQIVISAPAVTMDDGLMQALATSESRGNAGGIDVRVGRLALSGGAQLDSSTRSTGRGGTLTVAATDMISIAGRDQEGNPSGLFSRSTGSGDAGRLSVLVPTLQMNDGRILANTTGDGRAGDLDVQVGRLTLTGGAQISTGTRGSGRGGMLTVAATEALAISGTDSQGNPSGLFSNTQSRGQGGTLRVQAKTIELRDSGTISASSAGDGAAGNILLQADETFRSHHGQVTTSAEQAGGGTIVLRAGRLVQLRDSEVTTSVRGGGGDAGNVTVEAPFIVAGGSQLVANAFGGRGGNIRIDAGVFLADPESRVSASSTLGIAGTVDIRAPVTNLSGVVVPLTPDFARATALLQDRCAARLREGTVSTFVVRGHPSPPASYDRPLPSRLYTPQQPRTTPAGAGSLSGESPAAPQGLLPEDPVGRVQGTSALALPGSLLELAPCAR
jgi:filamentous hemagglutinin family protein